MNQWTRAALIALRIVVGWHFLYEGVWKIRSDTGSANYTTARYTLQATTARLHDYFARAAGVELEPAAAHIDAWHESIVKAFAAYKQLDDAQKVRLAALRDQIKLAALAAARREVDASDVVNFDWAYVHEEVLRIAGEPESERFSSLTYLQAATGPFRPIFRGLVPDISGIKRLTADAVARSIDERYREILDHFARAGKALSVDQEKRLSAARDDIKASAIAIVSDPGFQARIADYRSMTERVRRDESRLDAPYSRERLDADRKKLDVISAELLAIANEPLSELAVQTHLIATAGQLGAGPLPRPKDPAIWIDWAIKISLTAIGVCLLIGVFTRTAGFAAAAQLAMFYLASPPWPGLPAASLGGHYMYVDRNLVELTAALVIAGTAQYTRLLVKRSPAPLTQEQVVQESILEATR